MTLAHVVPQSVTIAGSAGTLIGITWRPATPLASPAAVLCVPPFGEELNKCRRMLALACRSVAQRGLTALLLDLYGTGDSAGDFGEARWEIWLDDLERGFDFLRRQGARRIHLLAVRAGALLASEFVARCPSDLASLVFWQPVTAGSQHVTQLLRMRIAANLGEGRDGTVTVDALRAEFKTHGTIEIGGYSISAALYERLNSAALERAELPDHLTVQWFEVVQAPSQSLSPASARLLERWAARGVRARTSALAGDPFWSTAEITTVPALVDATAIAVTQAIA